ncbi:MAG TPA: ATP-binding protein [Accumulibacter sp.]|nr:ATP-binding protein [Accumulibacter sp.]HRD88538.1 ATP-binding protein [Accumulibacter sp.]
MAIQNSLTVDVVDDDELRRSFARLLRAVGMRPLTYASAEALLADTMHPRFDCLVLDVQLPGTTGHELQEQLNASGFATPIFFITADDDWRSRQRAQAAACADYFSKSDSGRAMFDAIRAVVGKPPGKARDGCETAAEALALLQARACRRPAMNWITIVWPMVASACLTLGLIELRIALTRPLDGARLLFSLSAFAAAAACGLELAMMRADNTLQFQALLNGFDVAAGVVIASLVGFVWLYFRCGNKWLALAGPAIYSVGLVFEFLPGWGLGDLTELQTIDTFGGASYRVAVMAPNPLIALPYLGVLLLLVFVVRASIELARRGQRRRAAVIGGSVVVWAIGAGTHSALIEIGVLQMPYLVSPAYLVIMLAMAYELTSDVSAAAQLGRQLQESERRMDLASAAADLGVWVWDLRRNAVWATAKIHSLFGIPQSERLDPARLIAAVHPDDRDALRHAVEASLTNDRDFEVEHRVPRADAAVRWIATRGRVERDASGSPILLRGVALDISARRRSELELQQLQSQLAHSSRVSMLGQLSSALAHELHQPLCAILRNAEAAELFLQQDPPMLGELRPILADIRADNQRARDVIERLRRLLKRRSMASQTLALGDLFGDTAALTRADAAARSIRVEIEGGSDLPKVQGDPVHIQQVLLNLVVNAMDAIDREPADDRWVAVRARQHGRSEVEVAVSDSGHGIRPEDLGSLFEPFFTTKAEGMGIGLTIARTIVEAHGGRLWAENVPPAGTTFRFTLPVAAEGAVR